ncbi:MAG: hypothetical protein A2Y81_00970 [Nitrospirae bacterium RBG_13_43_8]|nr:MAG: hypothetical protein A2Y81_00970 [Nitrospirae bacterium RBG_13_43_8]
MPLLKILYVNSPKYDLITALHIEGLQSIDNVELRCTTLGNYARPEQVLYKWDAIDYGNQEADVIILGSRPYVESDVFWSIKRKGMICVRMEGGDESALGVRLRDLFKYDFIFKRELYLRSGSLKHLWSSLYSRHTGLWRELRAHPLVPFPFFHSMGNHNTWLHVGHNFLMQLIKNRVHPFPMGLERRFQGEFNSNPEFELSCMITPHLDDRTELIELLNAMNYPRMFIGTIPPTDADVQWMVDHGACHPAAAKLRGAGFMQNRSYYEQIRNSRACISVPGGGFDTLRFWEILGMGSLLISKRIALQMPNALIEGQHYVVFDTKQELDSVIRWLYSRPDEADRIRRHGHEYVLTYHTSNARALYFLKKIDMSS